MAAAFTRRWPIAPASLFRHCRGRRWRKSLRGSSTRSRHFRYCRSTKCRSCRRRRSPGLLDCILPIFEAAANLPVHIVAVRPGQEVAIGERSGIDALLLDDRAAEDKIVADGYGFDRRDAMYTDFVIVGPKSDPAAALTILFIVSRARGARLLLGWRRGASGSLYCRSARPRGPPRRRDNPFINCSIIHPC
jgi:PBP superfamily domain